MAKKNLLARIFGSTKNSESSNEVQQTEVISSPESKSLYGPWHPIIHRRWDGEKTPGELGAVSRNLADHTRLRYRSYDAADKIDTVKTITGKYFKYIVGSGLKLNAQPNKTVLELEGINENFDDFIKHVEARFNVWANSKFCSEDKQKDLHDLASDGFSTAFLGGDVLVICRLKKQGLTVQVVDGEHVQTPWFESDLLNAVEERGNYVTHGVEHNESGEHVGYFVKVKNKSDQFAKFKYIKAKGSNTQRVLAWMVYGSKQRADHYRGIPNISSILEKVNKLDRYTEAAVGKAEEAANMIMGIKHSADSTGENPFQKAMHKKLNGSTDEPVKSSYDLADGLANKITQTTSKTVVNLPIGAEFSDHKTDIETSFSDFHSAIFDGLCASMDLPPEVALMKYNSNYSASRAAIGAWQYITDISRDNFSKNFYKVIYKLWLEIEILNNRISAPGFIAALNRNDLMTIEAYSTCRFIGKKMPHIDPLKEVKAARAILGDENTPLASFERVTEDLNLGEWDENYAKHQEERRRLKPLEENTPGSPGGDA